MVKSGGIAVIYIIVCLSLTKKYDRSAVNIGIWWQTKMSILIIEDYDYEVEIVICITKFGFIFVDLIKHDKFF